MSRSSAVLKRVLIGSGLAKFIRISRRYGSNLYGAMFPERQFEGRRRFWEQRWSSGDYSPIFEPPKEAIPKEVRQIVQERWLNPGARILDIGCGSGWIASWLADQGYHVVGVDYSAAAVERARKSYPSIENRLEWYQVDILHDPTPRTDFDGLLDRGCLHRIPEHFWAGYFSAIRRAAVPGARFLLLMATFEHSEFMACDSQMSRSEVKEKVRHCAAPHFVIDRMEDTVLDLAEREQERKMPGVAFWMTAREA